MRPKKIVNKPNLIKLGSIEKTGFKNSYFDIIISRFALHYLKSFNKAYAEINRILKPNGLLILAVAHPLRDFIIKKNKNYLKQKKVKLLVYNNKVPIVFPSHTFEQYFSPTFFNFFSLINFAEQKRMKKRSKNILVPSFFVMKATKTKRLLKNNILKP